MKSLCYNRYVGYDMFMPEGYKERKREMKKLLVVLLTVAMTFAMFGCTNEEQKEEQTVTIWHTYTEDQKAYLEQAAADFNAAHEGEITVLVESQEYSGFDDTVYNAVMNGNGPDIIINYASTAALYVEDGKVADLSKYLSQELIDSLDEGAYKEATSFSDGKMHIFPIVFSGPVLFYNPDIFEAAGVTEVPTTWEGIYEASEKIHAYNGKWGFAVDSLTDVAQTWIMQLGVTIFDTTTNTCAFDTEEVEAMFDWYGKAVQEGLFLADPTLSNYFSDDYNNGNIACYVGSVAGAPYLTASWKVARLPQTEGGTAWTPAWNRGVIVFSSNEEKEAAACEFLSYFASAEVNAGWCVACNYQTSLSTTRETETYKNLMANSDTLNALQPETAGSFDALPAIQYVRTALKNLMKDVAAGTDAKTAIGTAYDYVAGEIAQ